jgi:alpha-1,3-fucosyltransferase
VCLPNCFSIHTDDEIEQIVSKKNRTALWIALECKRPSGREKLVERLKNYIDVDIYGNCGPFSCWGYPNRCLDYNTTHLFYLAFENSLCLDYLTEKSYKVMNDFIIPVIYSGVDISRFLPPKSYIDVNSFETVDELGKYLKFLAENPKEYVKYFWWKKYYRVEEKTLDLCDICKKLNEPNLHKKQKIYKTINKWFGDEVCVKPKIKF